MSFIATSPFSYSNSTVAIPVVLHDVSKDSNSSSDISRAQSYAVDIEFEIRRVFRCERFGFAGIANSDFIRRNPLAAVLATCGFIYANVDEIKKKQVEQFINSTQCYFYHNYISFYKFC